LWPVTIVKRDKTRCSLQSAANTPLYKEQLHRSRVENLSITLVRPHESWSTVGESQNIFNVILKFYL